MRSADRRGRASIDQPWSGIGLGICVATWLLPTYTFAEAAPETLGAMIADLRPASLMAVLLVLLARQR